MSTLTRFENDGIELVIDESGECFYPGYQALARICSIGLASTIQAVQVKRLAEKLLGTVTGLGTFDAEVLTPQGLRTVTLLPRKLGTKVIRKYNPDLYEDMAEAGHLVFLHQLAGYQIKSEIKPKSNLEILQESIAALIAQEAKIKALEATQAEHEDKLEALELESKANEVELERFKNGHGQWFSIVAWGKLKGLPSLSLKQNQVLGRKAAALCKLKNIKPEKMPDPRWGTVGCYPDYILEEAFN